MFYVNVCPTEVNMLPARIETQKGGSFAEVLARRNPSIFGGKFSNIARMPPSTCIILEARVEIRPTLFCCFSHVSSTSYKIYLLLITNASSSFPLKRINPQRAMTHPRSNIYIFCNLSKEVEGYIFTFHSNNSKLKVLLLTFYFPCINKNMHPPSWC